MRAAVYTRISTLDSEGEETSTARQEDDCRRYASERKWRVVDVYTDVGLSGWDKKVQRPGLEDLLTSVRSGQVDMVVIYKLDRLTRRVLHLLDIVRILEESRCGFASVNDPGIDTSTATGKFALTIMGAVAELESDTIRLRVKRANRQIAESGKPHTGGHRAFGWESDKVTVRHEEAEIIREVAARCIAGEGLYSLAREMEQRGIIGARYGQALTYNSLTGLLKNPRLIGMRNHLGKVTESPDIEPILTVEQFNRLQRRLGGTHIAGDLKIDLPVSPTRKLRLLTGMLRCRCCDRMMSSREGHYICVNQRQTISQPWLDSYVASEALQALAGRATKTDDLRTPEAIESDLNGIRKRLERLAVDYYADDLSEAEYRSAREVLSTRMSDLESELVAASDMRLGPEGSQMGYRDWWEAAALPDRRSALRSIFDRIWITPDIEARNALKAGSKRTIPLETVRQHRVYIEYLT